MLFTDSQLAEYEKWGAVTIDSPFTTEELDRAEEAWDRNQQGIGVSHDDPAYVDIVQHPYLEEVAQKLLRADAVHLWWSLLLHERAPAEPPYGSTREQWEKGCHVDIQATLEDFEAIPRRMRAELWLWLNDVPANRGAMRILPGSHRSIMEHWSRILRSDHKEMLPRVHGLHPKPVSERTAAFPEHIPDIGVTPWIERKPVPYIARRGQILIVCTAGLHSAWQNEDTVPRKALATSWIANGVHGGLPKNQRDAVMKLFPRLRTKVRPDRVHIVPDRFNWLFESDYEPKWPETFLPTPG